MCEIEHTGYSKKYLRFVEAHREAFEAAYLDQSAASANEQERLKREFDTLPSRHICSCRCPQEVRGYMACAECKLLRQERVGVCVDCLKLAIRERPKRCVACARLDPSTDLGREVSNRRPISTGRVPLVVMLDIEAGYAA